MLTRSLVAATMALALARAIPFLAEARAVLARPALTAPQHRIITGCFGQGPADPANEGGIRYLGDPGDNLLASPPPDLDRHPRRVGRRFR